MITTRISLEKLTSWSIIIEAFKAALTELSHEGSGWHGTKSDEIEFLGSNLVPKIISVGVTARFDEPKTRPKFFLFGPPVQDGAQWSLYFKLKPAPENEKVKEVQVEIALQYLIRGVFYDRSSPEHLEYYGAKPVAEKFLQKFELIVNEFVREDHA
ncbi:MAG: hypothetical protein ACD_67C00196G0002 [uncultured bacterium]|nr:MAG: hypothetical protein ACD_67C00196G0002 [uncultured bacterium]